MKILLSVQEIRPFSLFQNLALGKTSTWTLINVILQFLELDLVNINVSAKFYKNIPNGLRVKFHFFFFSAFEPRQNFDQSQMPFDYLIGYILSISMCMHKIHHNIPFSSRDRAIFTFFRFWSSAKPRPIKRVISQSLGLDLVSINVYAEVYQNIPLSSRERVIFTFFRIWTPATPQPIPNGMWQPLGLHLVNINAYGKLYQTIPNGLRVMDIFHEHAGDKIFTNRPVTKSNVWL